MRLIAALFVLALAATGLAAETVRLGDRFYVIELPARSQGAPLILALHGGGGSPDQFARASGLVRAALGAGYAVAFPAGSGRRGDSLLTWNGGYCCGLAARRRVDDQTFLADVIRDATDRYGLDAARVYLTGMSNGSIMIETFAARNPGLVRAIAGVAGTMDTSRTMVAGRVPALIIHGTADPMVPYEGGRGESSVTRTDFASVPSVVAAFLAPWGPVQTTSRRIDRRDDGTSVTVTDHVSGDRVVLRLMTVEGGGHHWPGGRKARLNEGKTEEIGANAEILRFFALHR
jgi:polyhydroxybutyrate depolymerase